MISLKKLLENTAYVAVNGSEAISVSEVAYDSGKITKDCLFVCIEGAKADGHDFIETVIKNGAAAIVVSKDIEPSRYDKSTVVIKVADTRKALAFISAAYFGHPSKYLKTIGITGTKGKTTTTYLIKSALEQAGLKVGLIGTIETIIGGEHIKAQNTTPESFVLQSYLRRMVDIGCDAVVMEVSSQGLKLHRTAGFTFDIGIFTNLSSDHIGPHEHADFDEYKYCKSLLFKQCRTGIVNMDDAYTSDIIKEHTCELFGYSIGEPQNDTDKTVWANNIEFINRDGTLSVTCNINGLLNFKAEIGSPGLFSVYNALAALSVCRHFDISDEIMKEAILKSRVKGRIESIPISEDFTLLIDYAHNAMSLESLLTTLRAYKPKRLVCLFGCGGDRDPERRFSMGEVSGRLADLTVITSDNPRTENPLKIIEDIKTGIMRTNGEFSEIADRTAAIAFVIKNALKGDIIVLAGKGHEDYQEIQGKKYPMDERDIIRDIVENGRNANNNTVHAKVPEIYGGD